MQKLVDYTREKDKKDSMEAYRKWIEHLTWLGIKVEKPSGQKLRVASSTWGK
ncbi:MAG: hypothetical protein H5U02_10195 [Clostridia bacterium]|nr:hypothetical protein [Clostridia bacterium]